ncbi:MAG: hypothetical protein EZS28_050153, partial [Streblomastix strix]
EDEEEDDEEDEEEDDDEDEEEDDDEDDDEEEDDEGGRGGRSFKEKAGGRGNENETLFQSSGDRYGREFYNDQALGGEEEGFYDEGSKKGDLRLETGLVQENEGDCYGEGTDQREEVNDQLLDRECGANNC